MKFVYAFALCAVLAFTYVQAQAASVCDPDGSGEPDCSSQKDGVIVRNNWDPTHYWQCKGGAAESVRCPSQTGFLSSVNGCVPWSQWQWVPPCPETS